MSGQTTNPRGPITLSEDDWGVQSPPQESIWVPLPFLEGDWIPRETNSSKPEFIFGHFEKGFPIPITNRHLTIGEGW